MNQPTTEEALPKPLSKAERIKRLRDEAELTLQTLGVLLLLLDEERRKKEL